MEIETESERERRGKNGRDSATNLAGNATASFGQNSLLLNLLVFKYKEST